MPWYYFEGKYRKGAKIMRKGTTSAILTVLSVVFAWSLFSGICGAQKQGEAGRDAQSAYNIPEEKKQQWESMKNLVEKEYNVCLEHCGNDNNCLARCDSVYKTRLERERERISHQ
jgi:hypothetical protein